MAAAARRPALMPTATEEIMRWASPVIHFRRTATRDPELRGLPIREGDKVVLWLISGNFDEDSFRDPLASTSSASPTTTSPSAAAAPTSAWERTSPSWRRG